MFLLTMNPHCQLGTSQHHISHGRHGRRIAPMAPMLRIRTTKAGDETTRPKEGSCMSFFPLGEAGAAYVFQNDHATNGTTLPKNHGQWIGFVGKIYRKPERFSHWIWGFPVKFPLNQSIDHGETFIPWKKTAAKSPWKNPWKPHDLDSASGGCTLQKTRIDMGKILEVHLFSEKRYLKKSRGFSI